MNMERFLSQEFCTSDVLLYREPNKSGDKANVFYFCLHDRNQDFYFFLNDQKSFDGQSVRALLPEEERFDCMWYSYDEEITKQMEQFPEEFEEGDDFSWEVFKTQRLEHLVDCDEFEGDLPESAWHAVQVLSSSGKYTGQHLLEVEKQFEQAQIEYQQQKLGKGKGHQTTLFEFDR